VAFFPAVDRNAGRPYLPRGVDAERFVSICMSFDAGGRRIRSFPRLMELNWWKSTVEAYGVLAVTILIDVICVHLFHPADRPPRGSEELQGAPTRRRSAAAPSNVERSRRLNANRDIAILGIGS